MLTFRAVPLNVWSYQLMCWGFRPTHIRPRPWRLIVLTAQGTISVGWVRKRLEPHNRKRHQPPAPNRGGRNFSSRRSIARYLANSKQPATLLSGLSAEHSRNVGSGSVRDLVVNDSATRARSGVPVGAEFFLVAQTLKSTTCFFAAVTTSRKRRRRADSVE